MGGPFNSAWALLKTNLNAPPINQHHIQQMNEFVNSIPPHILTENQSYRLTPEEGRTLQLQNRAYELARGANPQPPNMTDEEYEDAIELSGERRLAGMMDRKIPDYPWPKKHPFQTTFENDGSINRDPKVSRQRKLNARINRESVRRDAVPSQIKISPRENNRRGSNISLVNDEGKVLSQISGDGGDSYNSHIHDFYGSTPEPYRRQGMYRKLMQALIGAGIPIVSNERNYQSNPFHQKFLESLPPNILSSYVDEYGNPRTKHPFLEGLEERVENLSHTTPLEYYQNKVPQFLDAQRKPSGLNTKDYGAIPIVNQANQARSMDELAEQDSAKIRRGQGHELESVGIGVTQPMARNTTQSSLNLNLDFPTYNNLRPRPLPRPHQRYTTQQQNSYPTDDFYAQVLRLSQEGLENTRNQQ